jgi:hypothetical protein
LKLSEFVNDGIITISNDVSTTQTITFDLPFEKDGGLASIYQLQTVTIGYVVSSIGGFVYFGVLVCNLCFSFFNKRKFENDLVDQVLKDK